MNFIRRYCERVNPGASIRHVVWYEIIRSGCKIALTALYDLRVHGAEYLAGDGPALVVSNHQSHFDPPIIGAGTRRQPSFIARKTLWGESPRGRVFGGFISSLDAIPIDQERGDIAAIKMAIEKLRTGHIVVIFAEGSRTHDGALNEFKEGTSLLIRRGKAPVVPAAIEGAFDVWPRMQPAPRWRGVIEVNFGPPVPYQTLKEAGDDALGLLRMRVDELRLEARRRIRNRTDGRYPPPGAGDYRFDDPDAPKRNPDPYTQGK